MKIRRKNKPRRDSFKSTPSGRFFDRDINDLKCTDEDLLQRPDRVKYHYATYVTEFEPGRSKAAKMERDAKLGPLCDMPEVDHWALEEYFWHGVPDDNWHPMEAYLDFVDEALSAAGKAQLRQWKEARLGIFRIGRVQGDTVSIEEWDVECKAVSSQPFRAISLGMGGAKPFRGLQGHLLVTYLSPWKPADNLYCSMGYSIMPTVEKLSAYEFLLGFRVPELAVRPLAWKTNPTARRNYFREWRQRDWIIWLSERLQFPFRALTMEPGQESLTAVTVTDLLYSTRATSQRVGVYVQVSGSQGISIIGLSNLMVLDLAGPNWGPVAEYVEYRQLAGPPPGTKGKHLLFMDQTTQLDENDD